MTQRTDENAFQTHSCDSVRVVGAGRGEGRGIDGTIVEKS